jgi:hypothetical protein
MGCKYIQKLMLVMMELLTFILLKVQANDIARISLHPLSRSILLPHFSKLDKVQTNDVLPTTFPPPPMPIPYLHSLEFDEVEETIHTCFAHAVKFCTKKWPLYNSFKQHRN